MTNVKPQYKHSELTEAIINAFYHVYKTLGYEADLIVNGLVIVEIKAVEALASEHEAQLLNYLRATDIEVGLLLNFGPKPQVKRKIYEAARSRNP
jgi:hypothetical protein